MTKSTATVEITEDASNENNITLPKTLLFRIANTTEEFIGQLIAIVPNKEDEDGIETLIIREPVVVTGGDDDKLMFVQWCILSKDRIFQFPADLFLMIIDPRDDIVGEYEKLIIEPLNKLDEGIEENNE